MEFKIEPDRVESALSTVDAVFARGFTGQRTGTSPFVAIEFTHKTSERITVYLEPHQAKSLLTKLETAIQKLEDENEIQPGD